ncbi:uncharacterized protein LOC123297718 [Chrysoperla carnea]|uniref:uncharacterized protein LOC123297718 n=1 Tax=Chrysoperla carnea TaxID=189513 RepID=UPI001D08ACFA|nr:uncharacterized protein LOC123297718 [Chrysoperla carnea]
MTESKRGSVINESAIYTTLFSNGSSISKSNGKSLWNIIVNEYETRRKECEEYLKSKSKIPPLPDEIVKNTTWGNMDNEVFPILIPALNSMMFKAKKYNAVRYNKKTRFNGLDHLAELLWNFNPKHPNRYKNYTDIYDIPFAIEHLKDKPRKIFPKSEIWTQSYAALKIQSFYRAYLVRRQDDVQEMRKFWKEYKCKSLYDIHPSRENTPKGRESSRRLQCFCDMASADCINISECQLIRRSSESPSGSIDTQLFSETKYF